MVMKNSATIMTKDSVSRTLIYLAIFLVFPACHRECPDFNLKDFPVGNMTPVTLVSDFSSYLGNPSRLVCLEGDMLGLSEPMKEKQLALLDLRRGTMQELVNQGRGPGEVLMVWDLSYKKGTIQVYDIAGGKILSLEVPGDHAPSKIEETRLPADLVNSLRIVQTRSGYAALSPSAKGSRMTMCDKKLTQVREIPFPEEFTHGLFAPDNDMFQSLIAYSERADRIVTACQTAPYIEIYDSAGALVHHIQGPFVFTGTFRDEEQGGAHVRSQEQTIYTFAGLSVSEERFMLGYDGHGYIDENSHIDDLLLFDFEGRPLKRYELPESWSMFDVDWKDQIVYGIPSEGRPRIQAYSFWDDMHAGH